MEPSGTDDGDLRTLISKNSEIHSYDAKGQAYDEVSLAGSTITKGVFDNAVMREADFRNSTITASSFANANLYGANFGGATIRSCDFQGAVLLHADLSSAIIDSTSFEGATYDMSTRFPENFGEPSARGMACNDCLEVAEDTDSDGGPSTGSDSGGQPGPDASLRLPRCSAKTRVELLDKISKSGHDAVGVDVIVQPNGRVSIRSGDHDPKLERALSSARVTNPTKRECRTSLDLRWEYDQRMKAPH